MITTLISALLVVAGGCFWYRERARHAARERLAGMIDVTRAEEPRQDTRRTVRAFPPRRRSLPPAVATAATAALWTLVQLPFEVAAAGGFLVGVIAHLLEEHRAEQQSAAIEAQLAAAIYLMVSSLRAGASLLAAFESALEEIGPPLRPYFQEVAGRIRLGDDPLAALADLQAQVPLETFRLFATSLAIHWEVGGSLATTLSTVGQTVRDRIELSRRIRAQAVESHASVAVVLVIAYVLGFLMWRTNPDRLATFIGSGIGTVVVAMVIGLQGIGLVWMSRLNRNAF
jgi:tight adherence protein B